MGWGDLEVSCGPRSDDYLVMEQIKLCEILDAFPPALVAPNLFRGSQEKGTFTTAA